MAVRAPATTALMVAGALVAGCGDGPVGPDASVRFVDVVAGGAHTCALDEERRAWCWGSNSHGQLGIDDDRDASSRPLAVAGSLRFRMLSLGSRHTCGIDEAGRLWCWGANGAGQVGDGTTDERDAPRRAVAELSFAHVSAGSGHTCGVASDGRMWCWGLNDHGQLGEPEMGPGGSRTPVLAARGLAFSSAAAGRAHTCGVTTGASALCWGRNDHGELGGATGEPTALPVRVAGDHVFRRLVAGDHHTCGSTAAGEVWCWGSNERGQLGRAGQGIAGTPVATAEGALHGDVAASPDGALTCSADVASAVCWGGYVVDGVAYRTALHPVGGLPEGPVTAVAAGSSHACALVAGEVFCWGEGGSGQLGGGDRASAPSAVAVLP